LLVTPLTQAQEIPAVIIPDLSGSLAPGDVSMYTLFQADPVIYGQHHTAPVQSVAELEVELAQADQELVEAKKNRATIARALEKLRRALEMDGYSVADFTPSYEAPDCHIEHPVEKGIETESSWRQKQRKQSRRDANLTQI
jgi:hypothetical protein